MSKIANKRLEVKNKKIQKYTNFLLEKNRPPSRGGNTEALHMHIITISGEKYSFKSLGTRQWVFKTDTVSFNFVENNGYKNIEKDTLVTIDKNLKKVIRGNRNMKDKLRTAETRMPVSRREMRN